MELLWFFSITCVRLPQQARIEGERKEEGHLLFERASKIVKQKKKGYNNFPGE